MLACCMRHFLGNFSSRAYLLAGVVGEVGGPPIIRGVARRGVHSCVGEGRGDMSASMR